MPILDTMAVVERHQHMAPVDLRAIARDLGVNLYEDVMSDDVSGKLTRDSFMGGTSGFSIHINRRHSRARKRFTLAHEIAHFILHRDLIERGLVDDVMYRSAMSNAEEVQANRLAAEILMPSKLIEKRYRKNSSASALALLFDVSERAMQIRLQTLGLDQVRLL